jgi:RHS repeat-associated protein
VQNLPRWMTPSPQRSSFTSSIDVHGGRSLIAPGNARRTWYTSTVLVLTVAVALLAQIAQADARALRSPVNLDSANEATLGGIVDFVLPQAAPPDPSGAEPPYPLNHTLDGQIEGLGSLQNANFETAPGSVGTPPANSDLETAPVEATAPTNGDFESGDFTGWTVTGSPSIQSDPTHGYWARFGSNSQVLVSSAVTVPSDPHALVYDVNYQSTTVYSWVDVYVLTGPDYATSTLLKNDKCFACGYWSTSYIDLAAYTGQSVKFRFRSYSSPVGIDDVRIEDVFPGYDSSGNYARRTEGSDHVASLGNNAWIATDPFTLDDSAQFGTVELQGAASNSQYNVAIATGPSFGTWTTLSSGVTGTSWHTVSFNIAAYAGQQVKIRVKSTYGTNRFDDILGSQTTEIPYWTPSGSATRIEDAGNYFISSNGSLTSNAAQLPADVQNVSVRLRSAATVSYVYVELLRGANFSEVVSLGVPEVGSSWVTVKYSLSPYAGETVKLKVRRATGSSDFHVDDAGFFESVLPGWRTTTEHAIATGEDAYGTYVTPYEPGGFMFLRSSWISPGILDNSSYPERRLFSFSYDITGTGGTLLQIFWVEEGGNSTQVGGVGASEPTGYRTGHFILYDFQGDRGYFVIKMTNGGKVYSIADNVARQHVGEPFSRKVGHGIDTATGAVAFADQDLSVPGSLPLSFTRYYNAHSDRLGTLGFRWSHTYDTHLEFVDDDVDFIFGSGREEFFAGNSQGFVPTDPRIHSTLVGNGDGTFTLTTKDNVLYHFDAQGLLTSIEDLNANALDLAYDGQDRLTTVTGEGGVSLTLSYDGNDRVASVADPAGSIYAFGYDSNGDLVSVTDPEGGVRTYAYSRHRLTTVTDEEGGLVVQNVYDPVNRLTTQTDALGETISLAYDSPGKGATEVTFPDGGLATFYFDAFQRTTETVDPSGRVTSFIYDSNGNLDKIIDSGDNDWDLAFDASADLSVLEDPLGNPISFTYNPKHLPLTVTDARGNVTTYTYDAGGNMTSQTDPLDNTTTYTNDASGNVLSVTGPLNRTTTYTYNAKGLKTSETDSLGNTWTYTYTPLGKIATEMDPLGNTTTYSYDLLGRLDAVEEPLGGQKSYVYDFVGHLLAFEDPLGNQTTWDYDDRGLVEAKTDPAGKITTYTYDENRRMTSMSNPLGETTEYAYDEAGRLTSITDPLGNATTYAYDAEGRLASKVDPIGRQTLYAYDSAGRLGETTLPNGATVTYGYDPDGNATSVTDELGRVTTNGYDELSRLVSATDPLTNETVYGYDAAGQMTSVTDPLGNQTAYGYDAAGQMTSVTDPLGNATTYAYDDAGRRLSVSDATDRTTSYTYDAAGQVTAVTDPGGNATESTHDLAGQLTSVTSPAGNVTTYAYNSRGLLTSATDPLLHVTSYTYDDAGRLATQTDPLGAVTGHTYDDAGRLASITDDLGGIVAFGYDAASQLTSVTDANLETWTYGYNALGLRNLITDPLGRDTSFGYNVAGELTARTDGRDITTSYGYDAAGRLTSVSFPGGSTGFAYDAGGRRTSMTDATGTTSYAHDDAGRTTSVASPEGTISYGYDAAGRRTTMTLPSAQTVTYAYDTAGLLGSLTDWRAETVSFGYDPDGNRTSISRPNGVDSTYTYDAAGRVTDISHTQGAQELFGLTYTYDDADRPTSVVTEEGTESYGYDDLGRLTSVAYPGGPTVSYTYDPAGNRLTETEGGSTTDYTYDAAGQLVSVGSESYAYDEAGNLTQAGTDSYSWDHDSRIVSADVGSHSATYTYDGDGVRVGADVDAQSSSFLVDRQAGLPTVVGDGTSTYLHTGGLIEAASGAQATYGLTDRLGSVRGLSDDAGALVGTASYEAFGSPRAVSGAQSLFGFTGEPSDATGIIYLRARSLDPETGRMLSPDSVIPNASGTQGYNLYAYAADNPTTWTDPTGHLATPPTIQELVVHIARLVEEVGTEATALGLWATMVQLVRAHPLAAIIGIVLVAAFIWVLLELVSNDDLDRGSPAGEPTQQHEIETAPDGIPGEPPRPGSGPPGTSTSCDSSQSATTGEVGVDADALIRAIDYGDAAVDVALRGRSPIASPRAWQQFVAGGSQQALEQWLNERGGGLGSDPDPDCVQELKDKAKALGRSLSDTDAEVAASAIKDGLAVMTRDQQLIRFLQQAGYAVELF